MSKNCKILLVVAAISLAVGFIAGDNEIINGLGKALCGVFLIMFFIIQFFGDTGADHDAHHGASDAGLRKHSKNA